MLAPGRCLAHFAVDPELVYVTTRLAGPQTRFLPFKPRQVWRGRQSPVSPTQDGYPTSYLWEEAWARDSVLDLVRQFIHEVQEEDDQGRRNGRRFLIFPALPAARLRPAAGGRRASSGHRAALSHPALCRQRQDVHHRMARPPAFHHFTTPTTVAFSIPLS